MQFVLAIMLLPIVLCADPSPTSCQYYMDLEEQWGCSNTPYPYLENYGFKYCEIFLHLASSASPSLQQFLQGTAYCLQKSLQQFHLTADEERCQELEAFAFRSHASCYKENGFHLLSKEEQFLVIRHLVNLDVLLKPRYSFTQGIQIGFLCALTKLRNAPCTVQ